MPTPVPVTLEDGIQTEGTRSPSRRRGKLRTGVVAAHSGAGAKASIPTRFETILNTGQRENNAFGRRTYRFEDSETELPGPGAYEKSRDIVKQSKLSWSKKGMASFAMPVGLQPRSAASRAPGPGAYGADIAPSDPAALLKGHRGPTAPSAVFAAPAAKPILRLARQNGPPLGPGEYFRDAVPTTLTAPCTAMTSRSATSSFTVKRATSNVGPGAYESETHKSISVKEPLRPSHFSLSGTNRFGAPQSHSIALQRTLSTNLPPILASSDDVDRLGVPSVVKEVHDMHFYDQGRAAPRTSPTRNKTSFMFSETNLDRFGRPIVRYTAPPSDALGPGSYDTEAKPKRMLISSSWAMSGTKRDDLKDRYQPPGPAYYSPPPPAVRVSHRVADPYGWS